MNTDLKALQDATRAVQEEFPGTPLAYAAFCARYNMTLDDLVASLKPVFEQNPLNPPLSRAFVAGLAIDLPRALAARLFDFGIQNSSEDLPLHLIAPQVIALENEPLRAALLVANRRELHNRIFANSSGSQFLSAAEEKMILRSLLDRDMTLTEFRTKLNIPAFTPHFISVVDLCERAISDPDIAARVFEANSTKSPEALRARSVASLIAEAYIQQLPRDRLVAQLWGNNDRENILERFVPDKDMDETNWFAESLELAKEQYRSLVVEFHSAQIRTPMQLRGDCLALAARYAEEGTLGKNEQHDKQILIRLYRIAASASSSAEQALVMMETEARKAFRLACGDLIPTEYGPFRNDAARSLIPLLRRHQRWLQKYIEGKFAKD